uniref:Uncharacterized protein n=1 Tax=Leersia perrieri TaxID=77586 RepID=A0A0D9XD01_9ORYZ
MHRRRPQYNLGPIYLIFPLSYLGRPPCSCGRIALHQPRSEVARLVIARQGRPSFSFDFCCGNPVVVMLPTKP